MGYTFRATAKRANVGRFGWASVDSDARRLGGLRRKYEKTRRSAVVEQAWTIFVYKGEVLGDDGEVAGEPVELVCENRKR